MPFMKIGRYTMAGERDRQSLYINPHTNMRGPRGPRKILKAAQTIIIGISEPMFWVIIHNTEPLSRKALFFLKIHTFIAQQLDSASVALGSARTPQLICSCRLGME